MRLPTSLCFLLVTFCTTCLPALLADDAKSPKDGQDDLKLLQGGWKVVVMEDDGMRASSNVLKGMGWVFKGLKVQCTDPSGDAKLSVILDSSKTPKHINLVSGEGPMKGKPCLGIFKVEKDRLVICSGESADDERPTDFSTRPDSHRCMITFERIKE